MNIKLKSFMVCLALGLTMHAFGQTQKNTAEKLGFPVDTKLLIIHADDMGLSHSTNQAVINAFENKAITSGSIMVPCPWFSEIAEYVKKHPGLDVGIHFTLNAEWKFYKWNGVMPDNQIPGLISKDGYFYPAIEPLIFAAKPDEIEKELRAQIDRAIAFGIKPTHLDSHMGSMFVTPALFRTALKVGRAYQLPVFFPMNEIKKIVPALINDVEPGMIVVDNFLMLPGEAVNGDWNAMYRDFVKALIPGLNEIVVHLSYDNDEMQAIALEHEDYGSAWREKDLNVILGEAFQRLLKENQVQLITWKQIQDIMYPPK